MEKSFLDNFIALEVGYQLWESVTQCRNYRRRSRVIMNIRRVCTVLCVLQLQRGGYSEWIQSTSVDNMVTDKWTRERQCTVALRRNCTDSFCVWYEKGGCKSTQRLWWNWNRMQKGQFWSISFKIIQVLGGEDTIFFSFFLCFRW